jgi:hypothetical protein
VLDDVAVRIRRLLAALTLALVPVACDSGGGGPLTIRGTWETFIRVDCNKGHECRDSYPGTQAEFEDEFGASNAACVSVLQDPAFDEEIDAYEAAAANGRLTYDAGSAQTCLDAWRAQSCPDYWQSVDDPSPACDVIFRGTIPAGGACTIPDECISAACEVPSMTCV